MTRQDTRGGEAPLDSATVSRLLGMGMSEPRRPVDDLIERLGRRDGARWFRALLAAGPLGSGGADPERLLVEGKASLEIMRSLKESAKALFRERRDDPEARLGSIAAYFLCVAAALVHHGTLICGRDRREVEEVLIDLGVAVPGGWGALLARAAAACGGGASQ